MMPAQNNSRRYAIKVFPYITALIGLAVFIKFPSAYLAGLFTIYFLTNLYVYTRLKRLLAAAPRGGRGYFLSVICCWYSPTRWSNWQRMPAGRGPANISCWSAIIRCRFYCMYFC
jgi:hypothetical protein